MLRTVTDGGPLWQRRYRAPIVGFPTWSRSAPDRLGYVSAESGVYQLPSPDVRTPQRHQVTNEPGGLVYGDISSPSDWGVWHRDTTRDEPATVVTAPVSRR